MDHLGAFVAALSPRYDDDSVDRVHYYYTSLCLLLLAITISAKQYVGQPIQCWVPAQFTGPWEQYTENYCFVENTYWLPLGDYIPKSHKNRTQRQLSYYQWVPFVLALQALLFYLPCIIWRALNWQSGAFIAALQPRYDDDIIDRVHYYYTCLSLLLLSLTISAKQYVGQPIECWVPAQFTGPWHQYTENYCFIQNTYWLPLTDDIPKIHGLRQRRQLGYYQWVPFVLALQALFFYLPCIIWRSLNWQTGINVQSVVKMAISADNINNETRQGAVKTIARHMEDSLELQREWGVKNGAMSTTLARLGKTKGIYLTMLYIFIKLLYLTNVIGQFFLLNAFLGPKYHFWGAEILNDLVQGREWEDSGHFPRVTMCDFDVRVLGNLHTYTVQCVLMINMFNEKIYLFLWWWFFFVAAATIANLMYWLYVCLSADRVSFVKKYLRVSNSIKTDPDDWERKAVNRFVDNLLRPDGVFTLRMISVNAGDLISTELVECLWQSFKEKLNKTPPPYIMDTKRDPSAEPLMAKPENVPEHGFVESFYKVPVIDEPSKR